MHIYENIFTEFSQPKINSVVLFEKVQVGPGLVRRNLVQTTEVLEGKHYLCC